jgi:hypothetical protein
MGRFLDYWNKEDEVETPPSDRAVSAPGPARPAIQKMMCSLLVLVDCGSFPDIKIKEALVLFVDGRILPRGD